MRPIRRTARTAIALLAMCAALMLGGVAGSTPMPSHGDDQRHQTFEQWCAHLQAVWQRSIPGCPPPTPKPPPTTTTTTSSSTTTSSTTTSSTTTTTTSTTKPSTTPATIAEPPDGTPIDVPDSAAPAPASASDVGSAVPRRVAAAPVTEIIAAPIFPPGLPAAVPGLTQPEVPPAASFEDDVLLPGSIALALAVAGLATAFLVYQGAAGRRGPRGPTGPIDDGETLEFR